MTTSSPVPPNEQKEKHIFLTEVGNFEKQLWGLIHTKSLLHCDVQNLFRKVRFSYEKIILNDQEHVELQDVEYSLWKLHYKHIDEFRKIIKKSSANGESTKLVMTQNAGNVQSSDDKHMVGFKSFLSEAMEFYQNLIVKIRKCSSLPDDSSYKEGDICSSVEPKKTQKCQFLCHRFLVCLGDLARYREQYEKPDVQNHNWSVAASHYLEATMVWPDSGNPQNQLAVLAVYVGDEFLALYHCVRSLAVKEPFPDAWDNLILLFERNRSSPRHSLCTEAHFDFLKPSERSYVQSKLQSSDDNMLKAENNCTVETDLWSLLIRTMSFFFIQSSLEEVPCAFASAMRELDAVMALDDTKLKAALESYQCLDSARTGPFRALQVASIYIFIIENLIHGPQVRRSKDKTDMEKLAWTQFAIAATFIFMGRLVDRCLKASQLDLCPLLPAVLVFVEWLVDMLDEAKTFGVDEKSRSAMSYFFVVFIDLLKQFNVKGSEAMSRDGTPLWEDYELRGFAPVACSNLPLFFSTPWEQVDSFESGAECRAHRIINAAMRIAERSNDSGKWFLYDKSERKFYIGESDEISERKESEKVELPNSDLKVKEPSQDIYLATKESEEQILKACPNDPCVNGKSVATDEEEVILFKPLSRYNSAPLYTSIDTNSQMSPKDSGDENIPSDECLRRAISLLNEQNQAQSDPLAFHADISYFRGNQSLKHQESHEKDSSAHPLLETPISAGPPSLSAWVFNGGSLSNDRGKTSNASKHSLKPIEEMAFTTMAGLSINKNEDSAIINYSSPTYLPPVPSAPLLPDDAVWFSGIQSNFVDCRTSGDGSGANDFSRASQVPSSSNWVAPHGHPDYGHSVGSFMNNYPPSCRMTSSEWLRQYRESHNSQQVNSYTLPVHCYAPENPGNFQHREVSNFGVFDPWGNPMVYNPSVYMESPPLYQAFPRVYGADELRREKLFHGYQRPVPLGCGAVTDLIIEPQPLLQYPKEREWGVLQDPGLRGPTYMGN
ncbi:protein SMG7L-like isoform X2 [Juglans microcarpa x Juglans regia]|nr:protein SMG7L-like isoform X2 [Juglans microcarpa x Juglans regia]XP_041026592.1 protein SMG7L-like isoform X2 [Juglans microcarpa x Juglans regia]XP_041026593.1 protein SMG7L-like isoform X2 [Juglans microcarpa x Juglans regia]